MDKFAFRKLGDPEPEAPPAEPLNLEPVMAQLLESKVRKMFAFSGWEDGVDEDAAHAVREVIAVLDWMAETRRRLRAVPERGASHE